MRRTTPWPVWISIHAPHTGRDVWASGIRCTTTYFNPRAPYGARLPFIGRFIRPGPISIHAPHTGRDRVYDGTVLVFGKFQSTRPIRGATVAVQESRYGVFLFQSTRPIRGATLGAFRLCNVRRYFNPRAPYGARPDCSCRRYAPAFRTFQSTRPIRGATSFRCLLSGIVIKISIHAPHTGRDPSPASELLQRLLFQSTRPIRGATRSQCPA